MKKHLLTGLIILMPVVLTLMVIVFLFNFFTAPFVHIVGELLHTISHQIGFTPHPELDLFISRILALILLVVLIFLLGVFARWFFFKELLSFTHKVLLKIPFIKTVYQVSKDVISSLLSTDKKKAFKRPVLFPFPNKPTLALGFIAGDVADEIQEKSPIPLTTVFAPTAPHPISGFLLLIPTEDLYPIDMTNEEAVKYLVSCGLIHPNSKKDVGKTV